MHKRLGVRFLLIARGVLHSQKGSVEFKMPNPGIGLTWVIEIVLKILGSILPLVTPSIRTELEKFLKSWYAKAKETPNPWDDFLVKFLIRIVGVEIPD